MSSTKRTAKMIHENKDKIFRVKNERLHNSTSPESLCRPVSLRVR